MSSRTVILVSKEGTKISISEKAASRSKLVQNLLLDYPDEAEIPLTDVKTETLNKIKEYLEHYQDKEPKPIPLTGEALEKKGIDEWDLKYIDIHYEKVMDIILAANYMDIESLLDLSAAKIASKIKPASSDSVCYRFNVPPLSAEEESKITSESQWCMENI